MSDVDVTADESCAGKAIKIVEERNGRKPQYYRDFRRLLEDKSIDAVSIATQPLAHFAGVVGAAGKQDNLRRKADQ
jgi:predicted dehydrogenase